jgi:thiamine biosynthesis lipoprotein
MTAPAAAGVDEELITPDGMTRRRFDSMGTSVSVLVPVEQAAEADEVRRTFATWHATCTRFDPDSELSRLNQAAGTAVVVGELLFDVLVTAQRAARATDGLFDPTLLRPLEEIGYDRDFAEIAGGVAAGPDRGMSATAARATGGRAADGWATGGWRHLTLDPATRVVYLPLGCGIDLGGLAKGMAVDAALAILADRGVTPAAVDAGGDLAVLGEPPGARAWPIAVEGPRGSHVISLPSGALATSSAARRRWNQGPVVRHHLVDPRTGLPSNAPLWSVSVAARSCAQAEVAAKAAFLLGPDDGARFLTERGLAGLFLTPEGHELRVGPWVSA